LYDELCKLALNERHRLVHIDLGWWAEEERRPRGALAFLHGMYVSESQQRRAVHAVFLMASWFG
jgi:hypothetical protein